MARAGPGVPAGRLDPNHRPDAEALRERQWHDDNLPDVYERRHAATDAAHRHPRDDYKKFLTLSPLVIAATRRCPALPALLRVPDFKDVPNAFKGLVVPAAGAKSKTATAEEGPGGPNEAKLVFAAAPRAEYRESAMMRRATPSRRAIRGGRTGPPTRSVGMIAQEVSSQEQIRYKELRLSGGIAYELKNAFKRREIVVIFVDTWTLRLPTYCDRVQDCDKVSLPNCEVLVPWNESDAETCQHQAKLEAALMVALPTKVLSGTPPVFPRFGPFGRGAPRKAAENSGRD